MICEHGYHQTPRRVIPTSRTSVRGLRSIFFIVFFASSTSSGRFFGCISICAKSAFGKTNDGVTLSHCFARWRDVPVQRLRSWRSDRRFAAFSFLAGSSNTLGLGTGASFGTGRESRETKSFPSSSSASWRHDQQDFSDRKLPLTACRRFRPECFLGMGAGAGLD